MPENIFLSQGNILISDARFVVSGKTYPIIAISSVQMQAEKIEQKSRGFVFGLGGSIIFGSLVIAFSQLKDNLFLTALLLITGLHWSLLHTVCRIAKNLNVILF